MTTEAQIEDAGLPAPVVADDVNPTVQDTPTETASDGEVEKKEQVEKVFTQSEVDALIQKRLQKEERRVQRRIEQQLRDQQFEQVTAAPPRRENFRDDDAFADAHIEHIAHKKAQQILEEKERAEIIERRQETFLEKSEKAIERYPDFQSVVHNPNLQINESMAEFITESDKGAEVAYFLGKNPLKAAQISKMSTVAATRELVRIEADLANKPLAKPRQAPEPISPVGSRGRASSSSLPSDADDVATWMKKEAARVRAR